MDISKAESWAIEMFSSKRITATIVAAVIVASPAMVAAQSPEATGICNRLTTEQCSQYTADLAAYRAAFVAWNQSLRAINAAHRITIKEAANVFQSEMAAASLLPETEQSAARLAARVKYIAAVKAANATHKSAIRVLGSAPKMPKKPTGKPAN